MCSLLIRTNLRTPRFTSLEVSLNPRHQIGRWRHEAPLQWAYHVTSCTNMININTNISATTYMAVWNLGSEPIVVVALLLQILTVLFLCHAGQGIPCGVMSTWWRHQMETFSALLALCAWNSPVPVNFSAQRPVTCSFDVFFDLHLNKRLIKQPWGWRFETPSWSLWLHCNAILNIWHVSHWSDWIHHKWLIGFWSITQQYINLQFQADLKWL